MTDLVIDKVLWVKEGEGIQATGRIPKKSEFFHDHFPGFPVLPGVLALEMLKLTAEKYLDSLSKEKGQHYFLKQIRSTRFSNYLCPGDTWESALKLTGSNGTETTWQGKLLHDGKVAVTATLILDQKQGSPVTLST